MILIVKGHTNISLLLSKDSLERCKKAIEIIKADVNVKRIIITGGLFNSKQIIPVSEAMKKYLTKHLNISIKIETEIKSRTTIKNIENTIKKFSLTPKDKITIITSWYHTIRCLIIWKSKRFKTKITPSKAKFSLKKIFVEIIGIIVVLLYFGGIKFPEIYFRKKCRTI